MKLELERGPRAAATRRPPGRGRRRGARASRMGGAPHPPRGASGATARLYIHNILDPPRRELSIAAGLALALRSARFDSRGRACPARYRVAMLVKLFALLLCASTTAWSASVSFELRQAGTASAGLYRASDGVLVRHIFSGKRLAAGRHSVELSTVAEQERLAGNLELRVVSGSRLSYDWEGVVGNTGPLNGPGALKGLNPPLKIQIVGNRAVWGLGYNERQPSIFSFNLSSPQISAPVSLDAFDRLYLDFATDGELVYIPNAGFPTSNSYYHMNETFTVAYNLSQHSESKPSLLCMHNWTDPGVTRVICDTATSQPKPPFHCATDGCISTSNPDTWLALDWERKNSTFPAQCNSNTTWVGHCYCTLTIMHLCRFNCVLHPYSRMSRLTCATSIVFSQTLTPRQALPLRKRGAPY